jgi:hypothetical protein
MTWNSKHLKISPQNKNVPNSKMLHKKNLDKKYIFNTTTYRLEKKMEVN